VPLELHDQFANVQALAEGSIEQGIGRLLNRREDCLADILLGDGRVGAPYDRAGEGVDEFPHVAGPAVAQELLPSRRCQLARLALPAAVIQHVQVVSDEN